MQVLKPGSRLRSAVSTAEFIVTKAPAGEVELNCGGQAVLDVASGDANPDAGAEGNVEMGKRYVDEAGTVELLCTKAGAGSLSLNGETLAIRGSKALPSSD